jgi:uncharacterized zinc-type alcohol dehydrogenase-like protein
MVKAYAALEAGAALTPYEYQFGELGEYEVEIDVSYCGICHSDLSMINNSWGMSQYPLVPGHEVVGVVSKVGSKVTRVALGDNVGLGWHSDYCGTCQHCDNGDDNLCADAQGTIVGHHGGFAEQVRAIEKSVIKIPKALDLQSAGPLFCGGITVYNPLVQFDVKPTDKVAVIGIGGLGHLALKFLNAWGCEVTAFTSSNDKRTEALNLGAHHTLNSTDENDIANAAGRFDLIISTVNVSLDWNLYINTLKAKGRLHLVGAALEPLDIQAFSLIGGQRSISGSPVGSPTTIKQMLDFAAQHKIEPMIEVMPLSEVNKALAKLERGDARYRIVLDTSK